MVGVRRKVGKMVRPYPTYVGYGIVDTRNLTIKLGDPTVILFKRTKIAYVLYSPYAGETAYRLAEAYRGQGYDVFLINGASDVDRADRLQRWALKTYSHMCIVSH